VVQLKEGFLGKVFGHRPLSEKVIKPTVHQGMVALKQGLEFSKRDSPSLPFSPCYNNNTGKEDFVTVPEFFIGNWN